MDPLKVAVIGYGMGGATFHAPVIAATAGMRVAAVVTSNPERAASARRDHPGAEVVERAEALWERAGELDLVVVASPNRTHLPLTRAALAAGLPVVVDKPLTRGAADGRALAEEARSRGLLLSVYHNRRWDGDFLTLQRLLRDGALGEVRRFESRFELWRPQPKAGWRRSGDPEEAGGLLYDLGSHLIDQAIVLFGPVAEVYAELDRRYPDAEVDDDVFLSLTHLSGVRSHLWASQHAARPGPRLRVLGSRAAYLKEGMDVQAPALVAGRRPGEPGWGVEPREAWGTIGTPESREEVPTEAGDYTGFYRGIVAALREGAPPPVDPLDAVAGLEVIEAALRSARERSVVPLAQGG